MSEMSNSNIEQLLDSFEQFLDIYEDPCWVHKASTENIKLAFKLCFFLEKSLDAFRLKDEITRFIYLLTNWWKAKHRSKVYYEDFFCSASDQLLKKFFKCDYVKDTTLDIATRIYTSWYPKQRFCKVITEIILTSNCEKTIFECLIGNNTDLQGLEGYLLLTNWSVILEQGRSECVKRQIEACLSIYVVESSLDKLFSILALYPKTGQLHITEVQNIIVSAVLSNMADRSILSKPFWLSLFKKTKLANIALTCKKYNDLLTSLLHFIIYVCSMMKPEENIILTLWKSDQSLSPYPEISYYDVVDVLKCVCGLNTDTNYYILSKLEEAKEYSNLLIWEQLKNEINIATCY